MEVEQRMNFHLWIENGIKVNLLNEKYICVSGHSRGKFYNGSGTSGEPKKTVVKNLESNLMKMRVKLSC
jgi:hypothetical protein